MEQVRHFWNKKTKQYEPASQNEKHTFLRGPVPLYWLGSALAINSVPAAGVALVLWFLVGTRKSRTVSLTRAELGSWKINRFQKSRALAELAAAGLIHVESHPGRAPVVTVITKADS